MERKDDADYVKSGTRLVVKVITPASRPRKTWQKTLSADMRLLKVNPGVTVCACIRFACVIRSG